MAKRLSRRVLAAHLAAAIEAGDAKKAVTQLAAYLIETRRIKEADLIVRDAEQQLADRGIVVGSVVAAFDLSSAMQSALQTMVKKETGARQVTLVYRSDPSVLGGFSIHIPGKQLDRTIRTHLTTLKTRFKKA